MMHPGWVDRGFWKVTYDAVKREMGKQSWQRWYAQQRRALAYRRNHLNG